MMSFDFRLNADNEDKQSTEDDSSLDEVNTSK